jgi:hypothetical protein
MIRVSQSGSAKGGRPAGPQDAPYLGELQMRPKRGSGHFRRMPGWSNPASVQAGSASPGSRDSRGLRVQCSLPATKVPLPGTE